VSAKTPAKRGGDWNGKRPAWSREPFEAGNRAAVKHGVYLEKFNDAERAEIEEVADGSFSGNACTVARSSSR
jgi:hypothetical protein